MTSKDLVFSPGGVFHCHLPVRHAAHSSDPRTLSSRGSARSTVLPSAGSLEAHGPSGKGFLTYCYSVKSMDESLLLGSTGLDGGRVTDPLLIQRGRGLLDCAGQLQHLQQQLLQVSGPQCLTARSCAIFITHPLPAHGFTGCVVFCRD